MRLGHFQLVKKLGAGGMGEVYLATDLALDRPVAIKVLPSSATSGSARERLIREARAQARVHHPNVAHIYFIGEDAGRLYFAMEYVTGATVADNGAMPVEGALRIIHDAVLGLREAQRSGFTHRDVKPSNLMVDGHGVVKVLDFGIAAGGAEESVGDGPVAQTTLAGTPLYMAPEQARGEPIDFRADIYALGATLYQLVSGKPPFQADTVAALETLH
jgi:serine/threonine-protein kinase